MNNQGEKPIAVVSAHCSQFVEPLKKALLAAEMWTFQSFDLRTTRALHEGCTCPNHGTSRCTCELIVLLVYGEQEGPLTLTLDGRDGKTFVFITDESGSARRNTVYETIEEAVHQAASTPGQ